MINLRGARVAAQGRLDLGDETPPDFEEGDLADVLGVGFEAAPPVGDAAKAKQIQELAEAARTMVRKELLPVTDAAQQSAGFKEMRDEIDAQFRRWMQGAVRQRLS